MKSLVEEVSLLFAYQGKATDLLGDVREALDHRPVLLAAVNLQGGPTDSQVQAGMVEGSKCRGSSLRVVNCAQKL